MNTKSFKFLVSLLKVSGIKSRHTSNKRYTVLVNLKEDLDKVVVTCPKCSKPVYFVGNSNFVRSGAQNSWNLCSWDHGV